MIPDLTAPVITYTGLSPVIDNDIDGNMDYILTATASMNEEGTLTCWAYDCYDHDALIGAAAYTGRIATSVDGNVCVDWAQVGYPNHGDDGDSPEPGNWQAYDDADPYIITGVWATPIQTEVWDPNMFLRRC